MGLAPRICPRRRERLSGFKSVAGGHGFGPPNLPPKEREAFRVQIRGWGPWVWPPEFAPEGERGFPGSNPWLGAMGLAPRICPRRRERLSGFKSVAGGHG